MRKDNTNQKAIDIKQVISLELNQHPELKLIDIYKLVFQAYLGPAHLLADTNESAKKIMTEILLHPEPYKPLKQDIGSQNGFFPFKFRLSGPCFTAEKRKSNQRTLS